MRLLLYSDVEAFGGHEITVLDAVQGAVMVPGVSVGVAYCRRNGMLGEHLEKRFGAASKVEVLPHEFVHEKGDLIRAFTYSSKKRAIAGFIRQWKPDAVIVCQGHMGVSICGLAAAVGTAARVISYIPMAQTLRGMTGEHGLAVRIVDALLARAYEWPSTYLTSNSCTADQLREEHGVHDDCIHVVEYGPDISRLQKVPRLVARAALGLGGEFYVGMIGRIEFRQKGHDIVLDAINRRGGLPENVRLLIVGDGPDAQRMKAFVEGHGLGKYVKFMTYCSDISSLCSALDVLLMPSRYEGVPIVMLQAMFLGLPVIAADVDGMRAILPEEWRFRPGFGDQFLDVLERVRGGVDPGLLERNRQYVAEKLNSVRFIEGIKAFVEDLSTSKGD